MENTSKNFVLQLGSLVSLYVSLFAAVMLLFGIINIAFPDAAEGYWAYENEQTSVRFGLALLFVFFPTYVVLTRIVNRVRRTEHGVYLMLTRWLIFLSLFVAGAILLGDLVAVILSFLNGEITTRFLLKAASLLVVVSAAFSYYILDARGYWNTHETYSKLCAAAASLFVIVIMVFGFLSIDTPNEVRERRIDQQQVNDLQSIQYRVEEYYRTEGQLPEAIADLFISTTVPTAPEARPAYTYTVTGETEYELCATFAHPTTRADAEIYPRTRFDASYAPDNYNWEHEAGEVCFDRVVPEDPTAQRLID